MQTYQLILDVDDQTKVLLVGTLPEVNEDYIFFVNGIIVISTIFRLFRPINFVVSHCSGHLNWV
ncbi:hypothetical protein [Loigolactobacillus iwatensis]|uniref:hypothetical protein n=1 Tax=Loigolactobacillus iwatensis TaxID=1267156 RepID=UPI000F7F9699|nr:hypothetical protein [Loigolactobacillus iwatensis]